MLCIIHDYAVYSDFLYTVVSMNILNWVRHRANLFKFRVLVHTLVCCNFYLCIPFPMHLQTCWIKNIFCRFLWISFFIWFSSALTEFCSFHKCAFLLLLCAGVGCSWMPRGLLLPAISIISQHTASLCGTSAGLSSWFALPSSNVTETSTVMCNSKIQKESHVLAGTIAARCHHPCIDFLQDVPRCTLI